MAAQKAAGFYPCPFEELTKAEKQKFLRFNDLRGTAVTLLTEAGCTIQQVCSITGHTLESATRILRRYLASTEAIARAAILRFEAAPDAAFANQPQTKQPATIGAANNMKERQRDGWYRLPGSNGGPLDPQSSALTN